MNRVLQEYHIIPFSIERMKIELKNKNIKQNKSKTRKLLLLVVLVFRWFLYIHFLYQ